MAESFLIKTSVTEDEYLGYFKRFMQTRTEDMYDYVNACMKNDGDTEADSQRICLLNAIHELDMQISGTTLDDLKITEEDED